jgi:hypothetical protein
MISASDTNFSCFSQFSRLHRVFQAGAGAAIGAAAAGLLGDFSRAY